MAQDSPRMENLIDRVFNVYALGLLAFLLAVVLMALTGVVYHIFDPDCPTVVCWG